jgi:hypothetical protein
MTINIAIGVSSIGREDVVVLRDVQDLREVASGLAKVIPAPEEFE